LDEGRRPPGGKPVSITAVAERAGVGLGSVSRVLSGKGSVSPEMLRRVREAAESLGYQPNLLARGLRSRATNTIGFVISDITNPLLAAIVGGAEAVLSEAGYSVLLTNSGGRPEVDAQRIGLLLRRQVDGLIVLPAYEGAPGTIAALAGAGVPIVAIDRELPGVPDASFVLSDHYTGILAATRHLLGAGHRHVALVAGPDMRPARERLRAYSDAHASAGVPPFGFTFGPLSAARGAAAVGELLGAAEPPTAIILGGNQLLEGAIEAAQSRGVAIGRELALVCCDDIPLGRLHRPPIPTVMRDTDGMGRAAARAFLARIAGEIPPPEVMPTWFEPRADQDRFGAGSG
jgi:LacI family transcriptional regulator